MKYPIIDLHCDLLEYLEIDSNRTPFDEDALCSFHQLRKGNVKVQVTAIFAPTGQDSWEKGAKQVALFESLVKDPFVSFQNSSAEKNVIHALAALENGSTFCSEKENIEEGILRLDRLFSQVKRLFSISLTWNGENRLGGGAFSTIGLKEDGKKVIDWMESKKIAIDISHASDALAEDIFSYLDIKGYALPVIATHSNFRSVIAHPRNLPDRLAKKIFEKKGLMGLNLYPLFVGKKVKDFLAHVEKGLELGGEDSICFGADYFCTKDPSYGTVRVEFFPEAPNASSYPYVIYLMDKELKLPSLLIEKICFRNALSFMEKMGYNFNFNLQTTRDRLRTVIKS